MGKVYQLGERECSVQRRHQKIIEETPSAQLSFELREKILNTAVQIAKAAKYSGAGTVEFLVQDDEFYFMEMNTRLQVEHPVTELVMGVDLVKAQILTAMERGPLWAQSELLPRGHSIECRVYAEDPYKGGIPSTGKVLGIHWPQGPGRRFDFGLEAGDEVTPYYDSMIAKVIVWDETRTRAIQKMKATLKETVVFGIKTNIPYLIEMLSHPDFVTGEMTTQFISKHFAGGLIANPIEDESLIKTLKIELSKSHTDAAHKSSAKSFLNPWRQESWEGNS
jgi:3-methylcrotonyl-CoA carboxylase alpha subunit